MLQKNEQIQRINSLKLKLKPMPKKDIQRVSKQYINKMYINLNRVIHH